MGELVAQLVTWATNVIANIGYAGVALLIALEAVFPPIPSEVILPLSGSLSARGEFNVFLMLAAATLGSLGGASMLYGIGRWGGERRIGDWLDGRNWIGHCPGSGKRICPRDSKRTDSRTC